MLTGFRAGLDLDLGVAADDFAATRRAWALTDGTATIGRVFPSNPTIGPEQPPELVVARADRAAQPVVAAGMDPFVSFKPAVAACLDGALDPHLTALARWVLGMGRRVYATVWHEPENDQMGAAAADYTARATHFVALYTRAYQIMKAIAGDLLQMGPVYMAYQWAPGKSATADRCAQDWRVPDDACDFVGADAYTSNWSWHAGATLEDKADFQRWRTQLQVPDNKLLLVERGISRTAEPAAGDPLNAQAEVLKDDFEYLNRIGAYGLMYWNSAGAVDASVFQLGAPARAVFAEQACLGAATDDRFTAGYLKGIGEGQKQGRRAAFGEFAAWAEGQATIL